MQRGEVMTDLLPWSIVSVAIPVLIVLIAILIVWRILKDRKSGFPRADERTQRITGKAATYTLLIGNYFTLALMFMLIFGREVYNLQNVDAGYLLLSVLLVFSISFLVLSWFFSRKGD
jgi:predicted Na+-dependent transporter